MTEKLAFIVFAAFPVPTSILIIAGLVVAIVILFGAILLFRSPGKNKGANARSPVVRQVGSLKGNSRRCQVDGIKPVWGVLPIMHGDSSSSPVPGVHLNNSPVPGARKLPLSSNRQAPGARKLLLSNNLRPGVTRAPVHHRRVLAWEETNLVGMPLSRPSNRQPRSHRTPGGNPQHLLCSREHRYGGLCQGGRQCKIAPRHNNSKRLPPMEGAVLDSRGVNLPNSSQLQ